ncbi:MAG TPA: hypothetical protein VF507_00115 [Pyrinomonadaceae bacterium]
MTSQDNLQSENAAGGEGQQSGGGSERGAGTQGTGGGRGESAPDFGSARSDYGDLAYGGRLDEAGVEKGARDYSFQRRDSSGGGSATRSTSRKGTGGGGGGVIGWDQALVLLGGIGIGAALMYLLDPEQGGRRRALLRDKLVSVSNQLGDAVGSTARDLTNRAQGVISEASRAFRSGEETGGGDGGGAVASQQTGTEGGGAQ